MATATVEKAEVTSGAPIGGRGRAKRVAEDVPSTPPPARKRFCVELLRPNAFDDSQLSEEGDSEELLKRREPTMLLRGDGLISPTLPSTKQYTLVLDLDETVVYARDGPLYGRAYLKEFLRAVGPLFEVVVWTAGERDYAKTVLEEINEDHIIQHLIYRHKRWFHHEDYTKDLRLLGRDMDYVLMVENTPDCVRENPENGIIVEDFEVETPLSTPELQPLPPEPAARKRRGRVDRTLLHLTELLLRLGESRETVPSFLARCDLLSRQVVAGADGKDIPIYYLSGKARRAAARLAEQKEVKVNRDATDPRTTAGE